MISVLDTSICTENIGDFIIMEAVRRELADLFPDEHHVNIPTHDVLGPEAVRLLKESRCGIVGGTNLISSNMEPAPMRGTLRHKFRKFFRPSVERCNQWRLTRKDRRLLPKKLILLGVGWWQYQASPLPYTRALLRSVLHEDMLHSVRDEYTSDMLKAAGFKNVLNTSCVTLWRLDADHLAKVPSSKAPEVISTLTYYKPAPEMDRKMLVTLLSNYDKVHLWIQGSKDRAYAASIGGDLPISFISPNLPAFDWLLQRAPAIDYVGTRLHAGIRALQMRRRTLIVSVDNRATEISRDTGLPVLERSDVDLLSELINRNDPICLKLPWENISRWREQFKDGLPRVHDRFLAGEKL